MQALILTGGQGKRMRSLTDKIPKPLLPVGDVPFLEILINFLKKQEVEDFILATGYKADMIENYFSTGEKFNVKIFHSKEKIPLDTGGAVKKAENIIKDEDILILNGDSFIDFDLNKMLEFHKKMGKPITMAVTQVRNPSCSGQLMIDNNIVTRFEEKGKRTKQGFINAGVYIFQKDILKKFPENKKISLEKEIFPKFAGKISAFKVNGYFIDIGIEKDYRKFNQDIKKLNQIIR